MRPGRQFQALWRAPLVAQFHTLAPLKNRVAHDDAEREFRERLDLERSALIDADRVVALSRTDRRQMVEHYGARDEQIVVIPGGVDLLRFYPGSRDAARRELGLDLNTAVLLFVGRIQRLKGIEVLLRAAAELAEPGRLGRRIQVLIVGGQTEVDQQRGAERAELDRLRALTDRLGLSGNVDFVGAVDQGHLPSFYRAANVTVMPSSYESFGLVAAESMACGTPVVASQVGGLRSLVQDDETGFLIPWRHPNLFAERIAQIVTTPRLAERLGTNAAQAMRRLSWGATADQLLELYGELIESNRLSQEALRTGSPGSS
jgi:D-inositol-3-phosphate glycosyltransferase